VRSVALGPEYRRAALRHLAAEEFDVLVVGGGIVGAGVALDAASRGLSVALVEARDWAAGTSSQSSKLIHGGLRYLEQGNIALVREALKERALLVHRIAPHLVRPVEFLLPLRRRCWDRIYFGAGVLLYDLMGGARALPRHRHLGRRRAAQQGPDIRPASMVGAIRYYDAQADDARLALTVARTAVGYGATVASGTEVEGLLTEPGGRVRGASVRDRETGQLFDVRARQVISATGVWTDDIQALLHQSGQPRVRTSKGVHIVIPRERLHLESGMILRTDRSVLLVIPWAKHWIIGTTDTAWDLDKGHPSASFADVAYLLEHVNAVLRAPITPEDIEGVYAGLRPLLSDDSKETFQLSREHSVTQPAPGLIVVAGGKYTTYRVMAKDAVDLAVRGLEAGIPHCVTHELQLLGAEGFAAHWRQRHRLAERFGLRVTSVEHLLRRYGSYATELLELVADDPDLGHGIDGSEEYLRAEVIYAVTHEDARHLCDVLTRRTRISFEERDRGSRCATEVAHLMGRVLGWDDETQRREVELYLAQLNAERTSQQQPDDRTADTARREAADVSAVARDGAAASGHGIAGHEPKRVMAARREPA
jgi:glycerol-3-phosphate dehydrogenase